MKIAGVQMKLAIMIAIVLILRGAPSEAAPIHVRLPEGSARAFLVLRTLDGEDIAFGELRQKPSAALIESRLVLTFTDGSLRDEVAVFSQKEVFRLERYRLVQRG